MGDRTPEVAAVEAVDEVGNPTILATFTVIAAILPMAFVSGMMGPYMRPIPVGASVAMFASLAVAFIVTPYLAYRLLKGHVPQRRRAGPHDRAHEEEETRGFARLYARIMTPLMDRPAARRAFYGGVVALLVRVRRAAAHEGRQGQDAAVRQQERVPGRDGSPRRNDSRDDECARTGNRAVSALGARGEEHRGVRGLGGAVQLQWAGAALLHALEPERRRRAGEPRAQERALAAEPCDRGRGAAGDRLHRAAVRGGGQGRGDSARAAGAFDDRGRGVRGRRLDAARRGGAR